MSSVRLSATRFHNNPYSQNRAAHYGRQTRISEMTLVAGKIHNLRLAVQRLNGVEVPLVALHKLSGPTRSFREWCVSGNGGGKPTFPT